MIQGGKKNPSHFLIMKVLSAFQNIIMLLNLGTGNTSFNVPFSIGTLFWLEFGYFWIAQNMRIHF